MFSHLTSFFRLALVLWLRQNSAAALSIISLLTQFGKLARKASKSILDDVFCVSTSSTSSGKLNDSRQTRERETSVVRKESF
jgi:hypothetical protein